MSVSGGQEKAHSPIVPPGLNPNCTLKSSDLSLRDSTLSGLGVPASGGWGGLQATNVQNKLTTVSFFGMSVAFKTVTCFRLSQS